MLTGLCLVPLLTFAQNLLMNGSFEEENICTEYSKNCAPEAWISTSFFADYYFDDANYAGEGSHFIGLVIADIGKPQARNFIRSRLLCGLRKGAQYKVGFFIRSLHDVLDSVGVYFSTNDFLYQKEKLRNTTPQLLLKSGTGIQPSKNWQKVSFTYTATGEENFISIGDFKRRGHSLYGRPDLGRDYYFFIDKITLEPLNPFEHGCDEAAVVKEEAYEFNMRHTLLDKLIYIHTKRPPPVTPSSKTILQRIDTLVIPDVLFASNSFALAAEAKKMLDSFVLKVKGFKVDSIVVEGHTDSQGSASLNQKLSQNRAASVAKYMQPSFYQSLVTKAFASEKPVADNRTAQGRGKNRRVEIYIYVRE